MDRLDAWLAFAAAFFAVCVIAMTAPRTKPPAEPVSKTCELRGSFR
jgi:hypothetical protein